MVKTAAKPIDKFKKILVFVSMGAFGFSMIGTTLQMFQNGDSANPSTELTAEQSAEEKLQQNAASYQAILAREPNNKTALEGLLLAQIQLKQLPESIATLEN
ncbi:MAG: tetratricopeptide repeat protein [Synechococcaceae cyanobacterium RL_1_2]|nr:tetratricopeptide repeat protein [Synechococcaceae cyanobacterium RL_1_2]